MAEKKTSEQNVALGSPLPPGVLTPFPPVSAATARAAAALEHRMLAVHATSNLVPLNDTPG